MNVTDKLGQARRAGGRERAIDNAVAERFARLDTLTPGKQRARICFTCLHCKVVPAQADGQEGPDTRCGQGLWSANVPLARLVTGKGVKELRGRENCPQWESSR